MKKDEAIEFLKEKGIEFDETLSAKELIALAKAEMAKDSAEEGSDEEEKDEEEKTSAEGAKATAKGSTASRIAFTYRNRNVAAGVSTRIFTRSLHGDDFMAIADEFAQSNSALIISRKDE